MIQVKVIADSIFEGKRITTLQLAYPRFIHAEFMTHRTFCISGDAQLDFDLPKDAKSGGRRIHSMPLRDFADKWINGSAEHKSARHNGLMLSSLEEEQEYSAKEVSLLLEHVNASNTNNACRVGKVLGAYKKSNGSWYAKGKDWSAWRASTGTRRFSLRNKLANMRIRQVNENSGEVIHSNVANCINTGVKKVFRLTTNTSYSTVCTLDHRILTDTGWKRLGDIRVGVDSVSTYKYGTGQTEDKHKKIDGKWVSVWCNQNRDTIASRQNWLCHVTGKPLEVGYHIHHVLPKHQYPELAFDLDNVVAVNSDGHDMLHEKQGWQIGVPLRTQFSLVESIEEEGEIDTYDLEIAGDFANFFADGIVVHNSRNASSSRAVPVAKNIEQVRTNMATPVHWGKNQPGMQAREELGTEETKAVKDLWASAASYACDIAAKMNELGAHKQIVNRILEPFQYIHVVVTATEWDNFFALRMHKDAQPEIKLLAELMYKEMEASTPKALWLGEWHLPYITEAEVYLPLDTQIKCSAARCARVSYIKHDGSSSSVADDVELFNQLVTRPFTDKRGNTLTLEDPIHASPIEHQATPAVKRFTASNNFIGWMQFRELFYSFEDTL